MLAPTDREPWPPDYVSVYAARQRRLAHIRSSPEALAGAHEFYRTRPLEFINHWADTYDPRNAFSGLPVRLPFVLFKRQSQNIEFLWALLQAQVNGLEEKSRDMGATWAAVWLSVHLWRYVNGAAVGWGSRKQELVDRIGDPDSIFEKLRMSIRWLPREFLPPGFSPDDMSHMRVVNPDSGATITGEVGDNIGRGGRKLIYFKDESAHYEHPEMIEGALMDNTNVQVDISSVGPPGNVFHRKRESGADWVPGEPLARDRVNVFVMDWRDHPGKTQDWYDLRRAKAQNEGLLHVFAREVDRDYAASVEGVIIDPKWVRASIDAHLKLEGLSDDGAWSAALDVADEGLDTNALTRRKGVVLKSASEHGDRDVGATTRWALDACRGVGPMEVQYDCVGLGAAVKAEANRLKAEGLMPPGLMLVPWNAGGEVADKDKHLIPHDKQSPKNGDLFQNFKAQAWWHVARRFERTWRAVNEPDYKWHASELISISGSIPLLRKLEKELSQAVFVQSTMLKLMVDKAPDGVRSPNLADSAIMNYYPARTTRPLIISDAALAFSARR